jgi:quercetin dioxygenase-like cupin family protein
MSERIRNGHVRDAETEWLAMAEGTRRKVLVYEPQILLMRNAFAAGVRSPVHSHSHVQASYVVSGVLEITIGGRNEWMGAGDAFLIPSGADHAAHCLEDGKVIEVFMPIREDFFPD